MAQTDASEERLAILIDADNTPYGSLPIIPDMAHKYGRAIIRRAYGDWSRPQLQPWGAVFKDFAIRSMHQPQFTTGKNSTDSAMIIDAMDILSQGRVQAFMRVTSDSDFTGLAMRIREHGLKVIGVGRETAPTAFVKACEEFILIENLLRDSAMISKEASQVKRKETKAPPAAAGSTVAEGAALLTKAVLNVMDDNGEVLGSKLGEMIRRLDSSFSPQNHCVPRLADFVAKYPEILRKTTKHSGVDVVYQAQISRS